MSAATGTTPKKPAASETNESAAETLQNYTRLMREAGSRNGAWNPDPDDHLLGLIRDDVSLTSNEAKAMFGVKAHCLRPNSLKGRTAWGWTPTGKPFRATELAAYFGWDEANTLKWLKRPLDFGFLRKNEETGQLGIGACVRAPADPEPEGEPENPESEVDLLVCTDKLPRYLAEAIVNNYGPSERVTFINGWKSIKNAAKEALAAQKQRIYDREQNELSNYCKAFDPELPELKRKAAKESEDHLSVPTSPEPLYKAQNGSVRTSYIRNQSKADICPSDELKKGAGRQANIEQQPDAGLPALAELRPLFPDELLKTEALESLNDYLQTEIGDRYDPGAFVAFVARRRAKSQVGTGLVFNRQGLPKDFIEWARQVARPASHAPAAHDPEAERQRGEEWRRDLEHRLNDATVSDEEKKTIRSWFEMVDA